jgi:hypothetical protein
MLSHLVLTTFINPEDRDRGQMFELACLKLRVECRFLELEEHEALSHPTHMIPWFLTDLIGEVEPHKLLYLHPYIQPTEELLRRAMPLDDMDVGVVKRHGKPKLEAMFLLNNDRSRKILDKWIEFNDENPDQTAVQSLATLVRHHRTDARIRDIAEPLLHGIKIRWPRRKRRANPVPPSRLIQFILQELQRQKKNKQWLIDRVIERIGENRSHRKAETLLRMLRGDTQGGVYLVDACLNALELKIVRA